MPNATMTPVEPLALRLAEWGRWKNRWALTFDVCEDTGANYGRVMATLGPCTGYGRTTNEAINALADGMLEEGWPDDRDSVVVDVQCSQCKREGKETYLTDFHCDNCALEGEMVHSLTHEKHDSSRTQCPRCACRSLRPGAFLP